MRAVTALVDLVQRLRDLLALRLERADALDEHAVLFVEGLTNAIEEWLTRLARLSSGDQVANALEVQAEFLQIHAIGVGEKLDDLRPFDPDLVARVIAGVA